MDNRKLKGRASEDLVESFLRLQGLEIVEKNFSSRWGEIDIIARDGRYVVFVEVRSTVEGFENHPLESITKKKQSKILRSATWYLKKTGLINKLPARFDVVTVTWHDEQHPDIKWIKGAFTA